MTDQPEDPDAPRGEPTQPLGLGPRPEPSDEAGWVPPAGAASPGPPPYAGPGPYATPPAGPQQYAQEYAQQYAGPTSYAPVAPPARPARARMSGWVWPTVAALALVIGLLGGVVGAIGYLELRDTGSTGSVPGGLADVDTETQAPIPADEGSVAAVAQELLPSTVQISAEFEGQANGATGSGFLLDRQGHVVTNNHVVADAAENEGPIEIVDDKGNRFEAEIVGRSSVYDLAVLYVPGVRGRRPAALGQSTALHVGDGVVAIGSPLGLSSTVTSGIVSALQRPVTTGETADDSSYINAVQTDAAINPGNSGGPLVNLRGQVVGVNSAIATSGGSTFSGEAGNIGVGFAIPIEQVKVTADQILRTGESRYPVIGAEVQTGGVEGDGAEVSKIVDGSPAQEAGLEAGDLVVAIDGERVTDGITLIVSIRSHQPGEDVELTVRRDGGDQQVVVVSLGSETG